jgi:anti-anti-sigma regulatory factor
MQEFLNTPLLGDIAKALSLDLSQELAEPPKFALCPVVGRSAGGATVLARFKGPIGLPNHEDFSRALEELMSGAPQKIMLDMADASLSKSAVGTLLAFAGKALGRNIPLYIYRPSQQISLVLREVGIASFFRYLSNEDDILASLVF